MTKIVYKVTNKKSGKVYIGATSKGLSDRKLDHNQRANRGDGNDFQKAIATYGEECFNWEQIDTASTNDELAQKEKKYINEFNSKDEGYNEDEGGGIKKTVYQFDLEGNLLNSFDCLEDASFEVNSNKRNISKAALGKTKTCKGFRWSYSSTLNQTLLDSRKKNVNQYTLDDEYVNSFTSISEASETTGVNRYSIAKVCRGERKSAGGYFWSYN